MKIRKSNGSFSWQEWAFLALLAIFAYELIKQLQAAASNGQSIATSFVNAAENALNDIAAPFHLATSTAVATGGFFSGLWGALLSIPAYLLNLIGSVFSGGLLGSSIFGAAGSILGTFQGSLGASTPSNPLPVTPAAQSAVLAGITPLSSSYNFSATQ